MNKPSAPALGTVDPFNGKCGDALVAAFSGRCCGNMSLTYGETDEALRNRSSFLGPLGAGHGDLVCAQQVHGCRVTRVTEDERGRGAVSRDSAIPATDALVTAVPGMPIAVFTADCLSVFLFDPCRRAAGIVHAGWRSSRENICAAAIEIMRSAFGTDPGDILAAFGPCMRGCCYEVAQECADAFGWGVRNEGKRYFLDLIEVNRRQLLSAGVPQEHVSDCGVCTACSPADTFSYRGEGQKAGRMMSVIMLR